MTSVVTLNEKKSLDKLELSPMDRVFVEERTHKIRKAGEDCLHNYREMGQHLHDVKTLLLEHGKFQEYVTDVLGMKPRVASDSIAIYLNTREWEPAQLKNVDISAAREMMKSEFPEDKKEALLLKAKESKVTHKEVRKVVQEPAVPQEVSHQVDESVKKAVGRIAKKIVEPKYDDPRLPEGVTVLFEDPHQKLGTIKKASFDAIIFEFASTHQNWLQEHNEDFERILKDDGELIIITQQEFIPLLIYFFDANIRYNHMVVSRTNYVIERDQQRDGMLLFTLRFSNWLKKSKDKQQQKIADFIPSDSEYDEGSVVIKRNEASYLVGSIVPHGGNVLCLCTTNGYIEEAAFVEKANVTVMLEPQSQELANLTYRLSGYAS